MPKSSTRYFSCQLALQRSTCPSLAPRILQRVPGRRFQYVPVERMQRAPTRSGALESVAISDFEGLQVRFPVTVELHFVRCPAPLRTSKASRRNPCEHSV
eukprot:5677364-Pyramimonas_sp.AAC.1